MYGRKNQIIGSQIVLEDGNILRKMKVENGKSEYKEITNLCEMSSCQVKSNLLTMNTREDIIWELIDWVSNALFGSII